MLFYKRRGNAEQLAHGIFVLTMQSDSAAKACTQPAECAATQQQQQHACMCCWRGIKMLPRDYCIICWPAPALVSDSPFRQPVQNRLDLHSFGKHAQYKKHTHTTAINEKLHCAHRCRCCALSDANPWIGELCTYIIPASLPTPVVN